MGKVFPRRVTRKSKWVKWAKWVKWSGTEITLEDGRQTIPQLIADWLAAKSPTTYQLYDHMMIQNDTPFRIFQKKILKFKKKWKHGGKMVQNGSKWENDRPTTKFPHAFASVTLMKPASCVFWLSAAQKSPTYKMKQKDPYYTLYRKSSIRVKYEDWKKISFGKFFFWKIFFLKKTKPRKMPLLLYRVRKIVQHSEFLKFRHSKEDFVPRYDSYAHVPAAADELHREREWIRQSCRRFRPSSK